MIFWLFARFKKQKHSKDPLSLDTFTTAAAQMTFLLLLAAAALVNGVIGEVRWITNVDEFIQFKNNVNSGTNYSGTTVFLDSDLSFAGKAFEPIGYYYSWDNYNNFLGVFDGQGHVISDLNMTSSMQYVGLFGCSKVLTIKNVILDSSCSITGTYKDSYSNSGYAYIGGFIGYCKASDGPCTIENSVNMGSVTFSGDTTKNSDYLFFGGIAGYLSSRDYDSIVKNCANYGDVTHSGKSRYSCIGGIIGHSYGYSLSNRVYIYNCLNHGTITHKGTTANSLSLGEIEGCGYSTTIGTA